MKSDFTKKEFDANVNDEAQTVSLKATMEYKGFSYKQNNLEELAKKLLMEKIGDYTISKNGLSFSLSSIKQKDEKITASLHIKADLLPKIDKESIIKEITGK